MIYKIFMLAFCIVVVNFQMAFSAEPDFATLRDPFQYAYPHTKLVNFSHVPLSQLMLLAYLSVSKKPYAFIASSQGEMGWITLGDSVGSEKAIVIEIGPEKIIVKEQEKSYTKLWEIKKA